MLKDAARTLFHLLSWETRQRLLELRAAVMRSGGSFAYDAVDVAHSAKYRDPAKVIDRLLRYQLWIGEKVPFEGRTVVELGAGPLFGWALVGLALGAKRYYVVEPGFNEDVLKRAAGYFSAHRRYVMRTFGPTPCLEDALDSGLITVIKQQAHETGLEAGSVDLIISNSCLEHVRDLDATVAECSRILSSTGRQYHFVDFSDHTGQTADPFQSIYSYHPDRMRRLFARRGMRLNLLRACDIERIFAQSSQTQQIVVFQNADHPSVQKADPFWGKRYSPRDLGVSLAAYLVEPKR